MNEIIDVGYVLHSYRYRETSAIVDVLTQQHGRMSFVAKGIKTQKSKLKSALQPFLKLQLHAKGKSQLKNLVLAEPAASPVILNDTLLVSGLYLNELLVRLLNKEDACMTLYASYEQTITQMNTDNLQILLRKFEKQLIESLGYELPLDFAADSNDRLDPDGNYQFIPEHGFVILNEHDVVPQHVIFSGKDLIEISFNDFSNDQVLKSAKRLFRLALAPLLGDKPLRSREILKAMM